MTLDRAAEIIGFPDQALPKEGQGHQLANRAFAWLLKEQPYLTYIEMADAWAVFVKAIQKLRPEWICSGPFTVHGDARAFLGTAGYLLVFRPPKGIYVSRSEKVRLTTDWRPRYGSMETLEQFFAKRRTST